MFPSDSNWFLFSTGKCWQGKVGAQRGKIIYPGDGKTVLCQKVRSIVFRKVEWTRVRCPALPLTGSFLTWWGSNAECPSLALFVVRCTMILSSDEREMLLIRPWHRAEVLSIEDTFWFQSKSKSFKFWELEESSYCKVWHIPNISICVCVCVEKEKVGRKERGRGRELEWE